MHSTLRFLDVFSRYSLFPSKIRQPKKSSSINETIEKDEKKREREEGENKTSKIRQPKRAHLSTKQLNKMREKEREKRVRLRNESGKPRGLG
jgi:hypothetical protein